MTDDIKELQELANYYQNEANYYHEKATQWHKPMVEIDFNLHNYIRILPTLDPGVREIDWLFNRVVLLIEDLKEASNV